MMLVAFTFLPRKPGEMFLHSKDPQCTNYVLKCLLQLAAEVKQRTEHSVAGGKTHIKWPPPTIRQAGDKSAAGLHAAGRSRPAQWPLDKYRNCAGEVQQLSSRQLQQETATQLAATNPSPCL
jgi:hypothetical protein